MTCDVGFRAPDPAKCGRDQYIEHVETKLPIENPKMFGLHPNAEINYLTSTGEKLFSTIMTCAGGSGGGGAGNKDDEVKEKIEFFLENCKHFEEPYRLLDLEETAIKLGQTPQVVVCLQECERMNLLLFTIK